MSNRKKAILVLGLALFSMFFGAGNLIFPPYLGLIAGEKWFPTMLGFSIIGAGLPMLGVLASAKAGGSVDKLGRKVSPVFSIFLATIITLSIGPLFSIPRTGATVFEIGVQPHFVNASPIITAIVYFGITLAFVIKPSDVIDKIGKILTPLLLLLLGMIIIKGIINPIGKPITTSMEYPFGKGFTQGYQTMDALGAILFGGIVTGALLEKGFKDEEERIEMTAKAGLVGGLCLAIIYGSFTYLGAAASGVFPEDIQRTKLVMEIAKNSLGDFGQIGLSIAVSLACLTTSIGLTATTGEVFSSMTKGRLKYEVIVIITAVFSGIMSIRGVESIISLAGPILAFMYPMTIVLVILNVFLGNYIKNNNIYRGAIYTTMVVSAIDSLGGLGLVVSLNKIVNMLPFAEAGFLWILPAIIGGVVGMFIPEKSMKTDLSHKMVD